jgi:hypothetical protein
MGLVISVLSLSLSLSLLREINTLNKLFSSRTSDITVLQWYTHVHKNTIQDI